MASRVWRPLGVSVSTARSRAEDAVAGAQQRARQFVADDALRDVGGGDRRLQVDIDVDAAVAQQVDEILGGDVAARAGRERAAAEPADRCVEPGDARQLPRRTRWPARRRGCCGSARRAGGRRSAGERRAIRSVTRRGVVVPMVSAIASRSAPLSQAAVGDVEDPLRRCRAVERAVPCGGDDDLHRGAAVVRDAR